MTSWLQAQLLQMQLLDMAMLCRTGLCNPGRPLHAHKVSCGCCACGRTRKRGWLVQVRAYGVPMRRAAMGGLNHAYPVTGKPVVSDSDVSLRFGRR